ncbi:AEC family transporter [Caldisalinibacter kiritimatiensis]|uniref:Malate permease n=1 Tax=Caldisalinibacter kiritimatiensis TaxID=1304284 RepID=R1CPW8_9FIRM|nr:AEC family transporter [Caldisalinibacter kiritimatiensis]EOD00726.1 Malate permease [Caldisalinibacter kiritimatiensis]
MDFISVLNQASVLFILLIIGFVVKKFNIMTDELGKGISKLVIYVTLPALIITAMNYKFSEEMMENSIKLLLIGIGVYAFILLISVVFLKVFHVEDIKKRGVYQFLTIFGNVGFMGYPIVEVIFGKIGVFYAAIYNIWFNILIWTLGVILVTPERNNKINLRSLINPGIISIGIGFLLFLFSIELLEPIYISLDKLGASTIPMSMLVVGSLLGDMKFKEIFTNSRLMVSALIKLIIIPLVVYFVLSMFNLSPIVIGIPVIISAMPSAVNAAIFARIHESDYRLASQGVFLTTTLSIITIPLIMLLLTM